MDECTTGLSPLLDLIVQVSSTHPHVKWIVSSRNWPQIKEHMGLIPEEKGMALEMDENSVSEAVKIFIYDRVQRLAKLKRYTQQMFDAVYDYLLLNAQGTFLWVALVCEKLASIPRLRTIEKLAAFPPGLDALYQRMMQQVCEHEEAPLCKNILGLVSTTYRPITIDEMTAFIDLPEYVLEDYNESLEEIIGYCGSFLTISKKTIFFVHQSAKDYLLEKAKLEILPAGITGMHIFILEKSFVIMDKKLRRDILSLGNRKNSINPVYEENMDLGPLAKLRYSCVYWINHLQDCDQEATTRGYFHTEGLIEHFLSKKFLFWLEALSFLKSVSKGLEDMLYLEALAKVSLLPFALRKQCLTYR
ncbi:HET-domain-containing protein [Penicillium longicatenatum]|nr:HET-domain-containing protein [Penicillium longicatenatum]